MDEPVLEFADRELWRSWLEDNHDSGMVVWLLIYKRSVRRDRLSYPEALEEAICYGWIDSRLRRIDDEKHVVRFSRRKTRERWSLKNLVTARKLVDSGAMTAHGAALLPDDLDKEMLIAEDRDRKQPVEPEDLIEALEGAGLLGPFRSSPPSRRRGIIRWIEEAKHETTRMNRIGKVVALFSGDTDDGSAR